MRLKWLPLAVILASAILLSTTAAYAWTNSNAVRNRNHLYVRIEKQAANKRVACGARNEQANFQVVQFILASYVCQKWTGTGWADVIATPPAIWAWTSVGTPYGTYYHYPCAGGTTGTVTIRAQGDGYYDDRTVRYLFTGTLATSSVTFNKDSIC